MFRSSPGKSPNNSFRFSNCIIMLVMLNITQGASGGNTILSVAPFSSNQHHHYYLRQSQLQAIGILCLILTDFDWLSNSINTSPIHMINQLIINKILIVIVLNMVGASVFCQSNQAVSSVASLFASYYASIFPINVLWS